MDREEEQTGIDWAAAERAAIAAEDGPADEAEAATGIPPQADAEAGRDESVPVQPVSAKVPARVDPRTERVQMFGSLLQRALPQFRNVIPKGFDPNQLIGVALHAIERSPGLLECTGISIIRSILIAGQLGLDVSGIGGQGYLVPYRNRKTNKMEAQFIPGYRGLIELARRGGVAWIHPQIVYANEPFTYEIAPIPRLYHKPMAMDEDDRGPILGAYAVAIFKDQTIPPMPYPMRIKDIWRARDSSASSKSEMSPWHTHTEAMILKTPIRGICKFLPQTPQLSAALDLEEKQDRGEVVTLPGELVLEEGEIPMAEPAQESATTKLTAKIKKGKK